ncbi:MAG: hypothetical protein ACXV2C_01375, partial [Candidatus Bathyarchaeia archaeon]
MKRTLAIFMVTFFLLIVFLPIVLLNGTVSAQSAGYSVTQIDHEVEVMYSGQVLIRDTIHVSGQVTDDFMIGLPSKYSASILRVVAFDDNNSYPVTLGVQLGSQSEFYGTQVSFNGKTPSVFTVAFVLSSDVIRFNPFDSIYTLDYPAYPSLTQKIGNCNVTINFPSSPANLNISKTDGEVNGNNYAAQNLAPYTNIVGLASFQISIGTLQLTTISSLDRTITIEPSGVVAVSDKYHLTNNSPITMTTFILGVPTTSSNNVIRDSFDRALKTEVAGTISYGSSDVTHNAELINATLVTFLSSGQSTILTADYNLPSATLQGTQYSIGKFYLFPDFYYFVEHATFTFVPPEGASIVSPKLSALDSSSTLTRNSFQETLTIMRNGISYLDYSTPENITVQIAYNYNPVWASFRPTFWLSLLAVIGCVGAVIFRKRKTKEITMPKMQKTASQEPIQATSIKQTAEVKLMVGQRLTTENIRDFTDAYEEKKQFKIELKSLESRAQKGKIPRSQYKAQRK